MTGTEVAVVRAADGVDKPQGFTYFHGVSKEAVGATQLAMQLGVLPPGMADPAHTPAGHETAVYVLAGEALIRRVPTSCTSREPQPGWISRVLRARLAR